jgi:putative ABC transport system substrate-binding protein
VRAQHKGIPVVGFLDSGSPAPFAGRLNKFRTGLAEGGYSEGKNVAIEYRWAEGHYDRLRALANDLVAREVNVIAATGSPNAARAALAATQTIPIVFANGGDPVRLGLVPNLSHPPANMTGVSFFNSELVGKRLEILRDLTPGARKLGFIANPENPNTAPDIDNAYAAARKLGLEIIVSPAASEGEFKGAFAKVVQADGSGAVVNNDAFYSSRYDQFAALAARYRLPTIYYLRSFVASGGLVSYGTDIEEMYRQAGGYVARIVAGAKPGELPVMLPTKYEFIFNLKTAKALGLTVSQSLLARADEVIE